MTSSPTMHRLHLATQAQQIRDTLPEVDGSEGTAQLTALVALIQEQVDAGDGHNVHLMALRLAAYALRLAEWAEGLGE